MRFKLDTLEIDFRESPRESGLAQPTLPVATPAEVVPAQKIEPVEPERVARHVPTEDELTTLMIENPVEFEKYAMREDLTDGDQGSDGTEE